MLVRFIKYYSILSIGTFMELAALLQKQDVAESVKAVIEKIVASALPALINQNLEVGAY